jgi:putative nucleotidyltransferase with HDIG domain
MSLECSAERVTNLPWANLRLPPFPQVAMRVLQLVNNENVQLHQLAELIGSDPAFASEVLSVVNSPLYALRYPATSIVQAVAVLGGNALQGMCITVGVRAYLGKTMAQPSMKSLWRHNLACAIIAQRLAGNGPLDKGVAYTAGILHDIGRAALSVIQPKEYANLLAKHHGTAESLLEGERALFGWDHCETGLQLITGWKLPKEFEAVIAEHHALSNPTAGWTMGELIKVSCRMADSLGFPAFSGCDSEPFEELLACLPAEAASRLNLDVVEVHTQLAEAIHAIELV